MINQVLLKGIVAELGDTWVDIQLENETQDIIKIEDLEEVTVSNLLLNNKVAIRGHLKINNGVIKIACDSLIILDGRGRKS